MSHLLSCGSCKAPWPKKLTEGRAYVGLMALDHHSGDARHQHRSMEAGRAGGLHLETERLNWKWRESFKTSRPIPRGILPLARPYLLNFSKQGPQLELKHSNVRVLWGGGSHSNHHTHLTVQEAESQQEREDSMTIFNTQCCFLLF